MEEHSQKRDDLDKSIDLIRPAHIHETSMSYQELKNEYVKALNYIDIINLEKNNLMNTIKLVSSKRQDQPTNNRTLASSKSSSQLRSDFNHTAQLEKRIIRMDQENQELKKLLMDKPAPSKIAETEKKFQTMGKEIEELRTLVESKNEKITFLQNEARIHQEKIRENIKQEKQIGQLNREIEFLNREVDLAVKKIRQVEDENERLVSLDPNSSPFANEINQAITKQLTYTLETLNRFPLKHFVRSCFEERFLTSEEVHKYLNLKDYGSLLLKSTKYVNDLIFNVMTNAQQQQPPLSSRDRRTEQTEVSPKPTRTNNQEQKKVHIHLSEQNSPIKRTVSQSDKSPCASLNSSLGFTTAANKSKAAAQILANGPVLSQTKDNQRKGHSRNFSQQMNRTPTPAESLIMETSSQKPRNEKSVTMKGKNEKDSVILTGTVRANTSKGGNNTSNMILTGDGEKIKLKNLSSLGHTRDLRKETNNFVKERQSNVNSQNNTLNHGAKNIYDQEPSTAFDDGELLEKERLLIAKERRLLEMEREIQEKDRELRQIDKNIHDKKSNTSSQYGARQGDSRAGSAYIPLREAAERDFDRSRDNDSRKGFYENDKSNSRVTTPLVRETDQSRNIDYIDEVKRDVRRVDYAKEGGLKNSRVVFQQDLDATPKQERGTVDKYDRRESSHERSAHLSQYQNASAKIKSSLSRDRHDYFERSELENEAATEPTRRNHRHFRKYSDEPIYQPPQPQPIDQLEDLSNSNIRFNDLSPFSNANRSFKYQDQEDDNYFEGSEVYEESPQNNHMTFENRDEYDNDYDYGYGNQTGRSSSFSKVKGTDFPTFKVIFGRTESKHKLNASPEGKKIPSIMDVQKRKKVSHMFQTYDVIKGEETRNKAVSRKDNHYEISPCTPMGEARRVFEAPSTTKSGSTTPVQLVAQQARE